MNRSDVSKAVLHSYLKAVRNNNFTTTIDTAYIAAKLDTSHSTAGRYLNDALAHGDVQNTSYHAGRRDYVPSRHYLAKELIALGDANAALLSALNAILAIPRPVGEAINTAADIARAAISDAIAKAGV